MSFQISWFLVFLLGCCTTRGSLYAATSEAPAPAAISLTLIPPSPVTDHIMLDIRAAVHNSSATARTVAVAVYLDKENPAHELHHEALAIAPGSAQGVTFRWSTQGNAGRHRVLVVARAGAKTTRAQQPVVILPSLAPSTRRLGGAWVDLYHHDEAEGKPFNADLARMTAAQWRELVRAMHAVDQDILVITMLFQNFTHRGRHHIETEGYHGRAYYPSKLFPDRMPIACPDPLEAILSEADRLGMHVLPGVGVYAFFDYGPGSLRWHEQVADELWQRYGHHRSFYGWYVSEEKDGSLGNAEERREVVEFFREFRAHVRRLAANKPVMLAVNCFHLRGAAAAYGELLPHVDILCPFGFQRMPAGDLTGEEAATRLQSWCDQAGCHLWLDVESFVFRNGGALHPRPIAGLVNDLTRFPSFEKTLHYQFPGLMSGPGMSLKPGGPDSVQLYRQYQEYLKTAQPSIGPSCRGNQL